MLIGLAIATKSLGINMLDRVKKHFDTPSIRHYRHVLV